MFPAVRIALWALSGVAMSALLSLAGTATLFPVWLVCALRASRERREQEALAWCALQGVWWATAQPSFFWWSISVALMYGVLGITARYLLSRETLVWALWCVLALAASSISIAPGIAAITVRGAALYGLFLLVVLWWLGRATPGRSSRTIAYVSPHETR